MGRSDDLGMSASVLVKLFSTWSCKIRVETAEGGWDAVDGDDVWPLLHLGGNRRGWN